MGDRFLTTALGCILIEKPSKNQAFQRFLIGITQ